MPLDAQVIAEIGRIDAALLTAVHEAAPLLANGQHAEFREVARRAREMQETLEKRLAAAASDLPQDLLESAARMGNVIRKLERAAAPGD